MIFIVAVGVVEAAVTSQRDGHNIGADMSDSYLPVQPKADQLCLVVKSLAPEKLFAMMRTGSSTKRGPISAISVWQRKVLLSELSNMTFTSLL